MSPYDQNPSRRQQLPPGFPGAGGSSAGRRQGCAIPPRLLMALGLAAFVLIKWVLMPTDTNPVTDESAKVPWGPEKDIALGLQAEPQMIAQHGGPHRDQRLQEIVDHIGQKLLQANAVGDWAETFQKYQWNFTLLADENMVNAFALPGGRVFFTYGLFKQLKSEDEIAGVMGHEIGHVIARHSAKQMASNQLIGGLVQAGVAAASDGGAGSMQTAQMVQALLTTRYGREDETESDRLGVQFMVNAGYNPEGLIGVMEVLNQMSGGSRQPEFLSTHPNPANRIDNIKQFIELAREGKLLEAPQQVSGN